MLLLKISNFLRYVVYQYRKYNIHCLLTIGVATNEDIISCKIDYWLGFRFTNMIHFENHDIQCLSNLNSGIGKDFIDYNIWFIQSIRITINNIFIHLYVRYLLNQNIVMNWDCEIKYVLDSCFPITKEIRVYCL